MLGRTRRTTRLDVGLAVAFAGTAYLVWALVAGTTRAMVHDLIFALQQSGARVPVLTAWVDVVFVDAGVAIDVVGMLWLAVSMLLVVLSSRQRIGISWAWLSAVLQTILAALGMVLVAWDIHVRYNDLLAVPAAREPLTVMQTVSALSLAVTIPLSILIWTIFVVWLLVELARYKRRGGPSLRDTLRTNIYR